MHLVIGLCIHENIICTLAIEKLHLTLIDNRERHLLVGAEGFVYDRTGSIVLEFCSNKGTALTWLDMLKLDNGDKPIREIEGHSVLEVVC
ncbi:unannotated protein [freshwater metagenome]|uniref:Unannotated protein n=1 Tax=freshwater metagenome TaxID=449393 RepID=A0A6J7E791_9ZZZZ